MSSPLSRSPSLVTASALTSGLIVGVQIASKAARDALFLGVYSADWLPYAMLASAAASLLGVLAFSRVVRQLGPARVLPPAFVGSALSFFIETWLSRVHPEVTAWVLYLHVAALGAVLLSGFWSLFSELFDPNSARRSVSRIAAGGTAGGVVGALVVERLSSIWSVESALPVLGALHLVASLLVWRLGTRVSEQEQEPSSGGAALLGLRIIVADRNLRVVATFVALLALTAALADFSFKSVASEERGSQSLVSLFAFYYAGVSLLTFVVQSQLAGRSLERLGLAGTLALFPGALLLLSLFGVMLPALWTVIALRGTGAILENSTHRSGYELLYTPLTRDKKRATKTFVDVAFNRLGDVAGGALVLLCVTAGSADAARWTTGLAAVAAAGSLALVGRIHRGYVQSLAESLKQGVLRPDQLHVRDATTRHTIAETTMALDRERLLQEIERFRARELGHGGPQGGPATPPHVPAEPASTNSASDLRAWIEPLLSGDAAAFRQQLRSAPFPDELCGLLLSKLAEQEWEGIASEVLAELAERIPGQLTDLLLDEAQPASLRRRIPGLLRRGPSGRGIDALVRGLSAERFDVRYRCGQALVAVQQKHPHLVRPLPAEIHRLVVNELSESLTEREGDAFELGGASSAPRDSLAGEPTDWLRGVLARRLHRRVEHAFSLLGLIYERTPLALCLTALVGRDDGARGTALEYLENVLPQEVRLALWPHLDPEKKAQRTSAGPGRSARDVLEDLLRAVDSEDRGAPSKPPPD